MRTSLCTPVRMVEPHADNTAFQGWRYDASPVTVSEACSTPLRAGLVFTFDFGRHMVGYLTLNTRTLRRCQDAPLRLRVMMGELPAELNTPLEPWGAWLSRGWMQDEVLTIEQVDQPVTLSRRMAGRYLKVEVLGASKDFDCALSSVTFDAVSSVGEEQVRMPDNLSHELQAIYRVSVATLQECMQTVYEDGPKRDRRLWSGDLYLQSLVNRYSFRNFDLTKRCLYLFAALAADDGTIISNIIDAAVIALRTRDNGFCHRNDILVLNRKTFIFCRFQYAVCHDLAKIISLTDDGAANASGNSTDSALCFAHALTLLSLYNSRLALRTH